MLSPSRTVLVAHSLRVVSFALPVLLASNVRKSVLRLHVSGFSGPTEFVDKSKAICFVRLSKIVELLPNQERVCETMGRSSHLSLTS